MQVDQCHEGLLAGVEEPPPSLASSLMGSDEPGDMVEGSVGQRENSLVEQHVEAFGCSVK